MDASKFKIGGIVLCVKDEKARKDIEAAKISFSNLQDVCNALGITAKSYTTEEFVKAMPLNRFIQFTHNQNDTVKLTDMPVGYATVEFQKGRTVNYCRGSAVHTTTGTLYRYKYESNSTNNGWRTDDVTRLKEYANRPTSANRAAASGDRLGTIEHFLASASMTEGKPGADGHILQFNWDNSNGWDSQLALINGKDNCILQHRGMSNGVWGNWKTVLDSSNYTNYTVSYEEGTWEPTCYTSLSGTVKPSIQNCTYLKVNDFCFIEGYIAFGSATYVEHIGNLPEPVEINHELCVPISVTSDGTLLQSMCRLYSGPGYIGDLNISASKYRFYFAGWYKIAS